MENVLRLITDLGNYANLIRRVGDAEDLIKKEPGNRTQMKELHEKLFRECNQMYHHIHKTFDVEIIELSDSIKNEMYKRDNNGQAALRDYLFDKINSYTKWLVKMNELGGFSIISEYHLGLVKLEDTQDGGEREEEKGYKLSLHVFVEDLNFNLKRTKNLIEICFNSFPPKNDIEDDKTIVEKHLECLSGDWRADKIMTDAEYKRLIEYANYTFEHNEIPKKIQPIQRGYSGLSKAFYQQTIYRLWKELNLANKSIKQPTWRIFTIKVFKDQYQNMHPDTIAAKFKEYKGSYQNDKRLITYKVS